MNFQYEQFPQALAYIISFYFPIFFMSFNNEVNFFRSLDNFVLVTVKYSEAIDTLLILMDNEGSFSLYYESDI